MFMDKHKTLVFLRLPAIKRVQVLINTAPLISATDSTHTHTHTHTRVPISKRQRNSKQIQADFSGNEALNGEVGYVCTKKVLGFAEEQVNDLTRDARPLIRELGATFQVLTPYLTHRERVRAHISLYEKDLLPVQR